MRPWTTADTIDAELIELVVQIGTRIGIIMEDVVPETLTASAEGLRRAVACTAPSHLECANFQRLLEKGGDVPKPTQTSLSDQKR